MKAKVTIDMFDIQINTIDGNSSISLGKSHSVRKHVANHRNEGFGEQNADGVIQTNSVSIVEDSDFMDKDSHLP